MQVISRQTRIGFLKKIFETLLILYESIQRKSSLITLKQAIATMAQTCSNNENQRRCITTVCGMVVALSDGSLQALAMNRLSTHLVENLIGITRECFHSQHTFENVFHSVSSMTLVNQF